MYEVCHRCRAELPERIAGAEALLFCPHCSAPQIMLPEHMRVEPEMLGGPVPPPPSPGQGIEWAAVLPTAAWVAALGGVLSVVALKSGFVSAFSPLWVLCSGSIVLAAYRRRRPNARISGLSGWRIGLVTGLLLVGAKGVGLSSAGMVSRFVTHSLAAEDDANRAQVLQIAERQAAAQQTDQRLLDWYKDQVATPENWAGWNLVGAGFWALLVMLFAGLGGMFSGALERRRRLVAGQGS
jgi:hypothetical protein